MAAETKIGGLYSPGPVPVDSKDLPLFLETELRKIAASIQQIAESYPVRHAAPTKLYDGLVAHADGTSWNPGAGRGLYMYYGGGWNKLG